MKKSTTQKTETKLPKITLKSLILGPVTLVTAIFAIYFLWWGSSKVFSFIHELLNQGFIPWLKQSWLLILTIWLIAIVSTIVFSIICENISQRGKSKYDDIEDDNVTTQEEDKNEEDNAENEFEIYFEPIE